MEMEHSDHDRASVHSETNNKLFKASSYVQPEDPQYQDEMRKSREKTLKRFKDAANRSSTKANGGSFDVQDVIEEEQKNEINFDLTESQERFKAIMPFRTVINSSLLVSDDSDLVPIPLEALEAGEDIFKFGKARIFATLFGEESISNELRANIWLQYILKDYMTTSTYEQRKQAFEGLLMKENVDLEKSIEDDQSLKRYYINVGGKQELGDEDSMHNILKAYANAAP